MKMLASRWLVACAFAFTLSPAACIAGSVTLIDFEDLPNANTVVTIQYEALGVLFSLIDSPLASISTSGSWANARARS